MKTNLLKTKELFTINVSNIGNIQELTIREAVKTFNEYVQLSNEGKGRAGQEDVFLLDSEGDILKEFIGFKENGSISISNCIGYYVQLSECGDMARLKHQDSKDKYIISKWLEIEYIEDKEEEDKENNLIPVIDPEGYNIPLNNVMRIN